MNLSHSISGPQVALIHPGTQYSAQLARQLARVGVLEEFWTGLAVSDQGLLGRWMRPGAANGMARVFSHRIVRDVPASRIHLIPWHELLAIGRKRLGHDDQTLFHHRNQTFQSAVPKAVLTRNDVIVGFDTSGWILAKRCAELGRSFVLDQSIGHPNAKIAVYETVRRHFPDWRHELENRLPEILAVEKLEHQLATRVVAASSFTRQTLIDHGVAAEKIIVNPYGVDIGAFSPMTGERGKDRPLRFAFVGQVSARKGIPLLLDVWSRLAGQDSELWLLGGVSPKVLPFVSGIRGVVVKGTVTRADLPGMLRQCDVFVFPSYFEGFGLVLLEAMACGLPIIASDATAAPDLITDGVEGFVIKAGDGAALKERMEIFLCDPTRAFPMGRAARKTAERFTWAAYGDRWAALVRDLVASKAEK